MEAVSIILTAFRSQRCSRSIQIIIEKVLLQIKSIRWKNFNRSIHSTTTSHRLSIILNSYLVNRMLAIWNCKLKVNLIRFCRSEKTDSNLEIKKLNIKKCVQYRYKLRASRNSSKVLLRKWSKLFQGLYSLR